MTADDQRELHKALRERIYQLRMTDPFEEQFDCDADDWFWGKLKYDYED